MNLIKLSILSLTGAALISCSRSVISAEKSSVTTIQNIQNEAQSVADHIFSLLVSKCGDEYYLAGDPHPNAVMRAKADPAKLDDEERFWGYQWRGMAIIGSNPDSGNGTGFEISKLGGKWYLTVKQGQAKRDFDVDHLASVQPVCPSPDFSKQKD